MARYTGPKEKKERRLGQRLFLKGERSLSQKSAMTRRPYPPGMHGRKKTRRASEFGAQLVSKQKIKNIYKILERQFRIYVKKALLTKGESGNILIESLEKRLDNVVYRAGFATARDTARQLVSHKHFLVNDKPVNIPSFQVKIGDKIRPKPESLKSPYFTTNLPQLSKKQDVPNWLELDKETFVVKMKTRPDIQEVGLDQKDLQNIVEFYSR